MKLINLLIRELNNCSLGGDFRVSHHAEVCQFDQFSLEINLKRACSCNYGIPRLDSSLKNTIMWIRHNSLPNLLKDTSALRLTILIEPLQ